MKKLIATILLTCAPAVAQVASNCDHAMSKTPVTVGPVKVFKNGLLQYEHKIWPGSGLTVAHGDYVLSGRTIKPRVYAKGDVFQVVYTKAVELKGQYSSHWVYSEEREVWFCLVDQAAR